MSTKHPNDKAPDWKDKTMQEWVRDCRIVLLLHRFLTDAEADRVLKRIEKWEESLAD